MTLSKNVKYVNIWEKFGFFEKNKNASAKLMPDLSSPWSI
jgi:hypothetical protein